MKPVLIALALAGVTICTPPAIAGELTGAALFDRIGGQSFDCTQGDVALTWQVDPIAKGATSVDYSAVVRGKTITASYVVTKAGRLSSDGYGAERNVTENPDGSLTIARADGKVMVCHMQ